MCMIKAIIGLGNPGSNYYYHRHNIGFRIMDELARKYNVRWQKKDLAEIAEIVLHDHPVLLIKPQTYMNSSGKVIPQLQKKGIKPEEILVVHDELELPFSKIAFKMGGSAKGHNGLKSIIEHCGDQFYRLRFGIGRPENREEVPTYVLTNFSENPQKIEELIAQSIKLIEAHVAS
jgi:PTH1 family peptidyl-tRNA hydrolase